METLGPRRDGPWSGFPTGEEPTVKLHLFTASIGSPARGTAGLRRLLGLALATAGIAFTLAARPAHADLRFTNYYETPIWVSFAHYHGSAYGQNFWESRGWYWIDSGQTITLHHGSVSDVGRYWYGYAIADDGAEWTDNYTFRVNDPEAFDYVLTDDQHNDTRYQQKGFFQMDVGHADNFTMTLY